MEKTTLNDRPWTPLQVFGTAFLFGSGAAGLISGINLNRMGKAKYLWPSIIIGAILFLLQTCMILFLIPVELLNIVSLLINLAIALGFMLVHQPHFKAWKSENWSSESGSDRYKPNRIGLLFLAGISALIVEVGIIALMIISFPGTLDGGSTSDAEALEFGMKVENVYVIKLPQGIQPNDLASLKEELFVNPDVLQLSGAADLPFDEMDQLLISYQDKEFTLFRISVGYDFFDCMEIYLLAGEDFNEDYSPEDNNIILNEQAASELFGDENPIGKELIIPGASTGESDGTVVEVIGVSSNFMFDGDMYGAKPTIISFRDAPTGYLFIKTYTDSEESALSFINESWAKVFTGSTPEAYSLMDLVY